MSEDTNESVTGGLWTLDEAECRRLLSAAVVGRLAFVDADGDLQLLPVNFRAVGDAVYFVTEEHGLLASSVDAGQVAFQSDHHDDSFQLGWSVLARGTAALVPPGEEHDAAMAAGLRAWASGDRTTMVRVTPAVLTGRRVRRTS